MVPNDKKPPTLIEVTDSKAGGQIVTYDRYGDCLPNLITAKLDEPAEQPSIELPAAGWKGVDDRAGHSYPK